MSLTDLKVAVKFSNIVNYSSKLPFDPPESYPEYVGGPLDPTNSTYKAIRDLFIALELDKAKINSPAWNPLTGLIKPGMTVFIKPNLVRHYHLQNKDVFSVITHGSILRPILDYVCMALKGQGKIIIGDSQVIVGDFDEAVKVSQIGALLDWYKDTTAIPISCIDLRIERAVRTWLFGKWGRLEVKQDPDGYQLIDLEDVSFFKDVDPRRLRIDCASYKKMYEHHSSGRHEYLFPRSFLASDVIINLPKLKTHRRTGVSLTLKSAIGIPSSKDSLPHYYKGSVEEGGDEYIYASSRKKLCSQLQDMIYAQPWTLLKFICAGLRHVVWSSRRLVPFPDDIAEAMWPGNDTLWRTILDLNTIVHYADKRGKLQDTPQRKSFSLIDGIIAGEKEGPVSPNPVHAGILIAGHNPVAVDAVATTVMGFSIDKIKSIKNAFLADEERKPLIIGQPEDITVAFEEDVLDLDQLKDVRKFKFEPHPNWKGKVELNS